MNYVYIPGREFYNNPRAVEQLKDLPTVINRFNQGYPDSVNGMWIEYQSSAHVLAHLLDLEIIGPSTNIMAQQH